MLDTLIDRAQEFHDAGLNPMPSTGPNERRRSEKAPLGDWKDYQTKRMPVAHIKVHLTDNPDRGLGILTGHTNHDHLKVECLDVEGRAVDAGVWDAYVQRVEDCGFGELLDRVRAGYEETTPSGGVHLVWLCEEVEGNTKLASLPQVTETDPATGATKTWSPDLIETRGMGGYVVTAPTSGYLQVQGGPVTIATVTPSERATLLDIARDFDQSDKKVKQVTPPRAKPETQDGDRPSDIYNREMSWKDVLEPLGWTLASGDGVEYSQWTRPGKDPSEGISATTNYTGNDTLMCFSSSVDLEPQPTSYSKFAIFAHFFHGGDWKAASRAAQAMFSAKPFLNDDQQMVGDAFALTHHERYRFDTYLGKWSAYDGRRWIPGRGDAAVYRAMMIFGNDEVDLFAWNKGEVQQVRMTDALIRSSLAGIRAHPRTTVDQEAWDPDPLLFNTPTGTIDLRTGEVQRHRASDLITRVSGCDYDPHATCTEFDRFLTAVLPNPKIRDYVQRVAGMSLLGEVRDHRFIVFKGRPRAGKSTLVEILGALHGEYGHFLNVKTLTEQKFDGHATELYSLRGRRFAWASEPPKSAKWDVGKIKGLTGGDSITARAMRQDEITFEPSHTLIVTSNHRPVVPAGEAAFWERYDEVPFEESFVGAEDTTLKQRIIRGELPGVLNWAIEGLRDYLAGGLQAPDEVRVVTQQARAESDPLVRFFSEMVERRPGSHILSAEMLEEYNRWARHPRNQEPERFPKGWVSDVQASCNVGFLAGGVGRRFTGVAWRTDNSQVRAA